MFSQISVLSLTENAILEYFAYSFNAVCLEKSQLNLPESTIIPPIELPPPFKYFDEEWITISAPCSNDFIRYGVAVVESTISGIFLSWATLDNPSISITVSAGLAITSPNITLVLSFILLFTSFTDDISAKTVWIPNFSKSWNNPIVPPYKPCPAIISSPFSQIARREDVIAAIPLLQHIAPTAFSSSLTFFSKALIVGLPILV